MRKMNIYNDSISHYVKQTREISSGEIYIYIYIYRKYEREIVKRNREK
jgi:hypothetical protein